MEKDTTSYLLERIPAEEIQRLQRDGLSLEEIAAAVERMEARGETVQGDTGLYIAGDEFGPVYLVGSVKAANDLHEKIGGCAADLTGELQQGDAWKLKDRSVVILLDNARAQRAAAALYGVAKSVRLIPQANSDISTLIAENGPAEAAKHLVELARAAPEWKPEDKKCSPALETITAAGLQKKDIPPINFLVERLIPIGLNILASPPKYGKSWMVLALCLSVTMGGKFLGYHTNRCGCLYLALEDSQRRLKSRMNKLLAGKEAPAGFHFATAANTIDTGLIDELEDFLKNHPDTGLIVIDTLQRVRGTSNGKEGAYAADYREVGAMKAFADKHSVAVLLVHHLRKMRDEGDPFNMISGTNGIMGAADTTMVLTKEKRGGDNATFSAIGRDIESSDTILRFNKDTCYWENLGDADWFAEQQARLEYQESPIVKTVKKLLEQSAGGWSGTAQQLLDAGRVIARVPLADSTRALTNELKGLDRLLLENDNIAHERKTNGSGGGKHRFYYADAPQFEEVEQSEIDPFSGG